MTPARLPDADVVIAGGGLAGACAALWLAGGTSVLVLDDSKGGASSVPGGLANPLMARKARLVWRADEALDSFAQTTDSAGASSAISPAPLLRPAAAAAQAAFFQEVAKQHPMQGMWLPPKAIAAAHPATHAPHGALRVSHGRAVDVPSFARAVCTAAQRRGAAFAEGCVHGWTSERVVVRAEVETPSGRHIVRAGKLLLCVGAGYIDFPALRTLRLHRIKGQVVRVRRPGSVPADLPPLSGSGYVVPAGDDLIVGSSYEHDFSDLRPDPAVAQRIVAKAAQMLPALAEAHVLDAWAGIRVTVPETRLPMVGPLPGESNVWVLTGLGSKGLLMAPLLARRLARYLDDPERIPPEIRVRTA